MTELGADVRALRDAAARLGDLGNRMEHVSQALNIAAADLPRRFSFLATTVTSPAGRVQRESRRMFDLNFLLRSNADAQERTSTATDPMAMMTLRRGAIRAGRDVAVATIGSVAAVGMSRQSLGGAAWRQVHGGLSTFSHMGSLKATTALAEQVWSTGRALSRSRWVSPNAPRTLNGLLKMPVSDAPRRFALRAVSLSTKAKYLKQARGGVIPILGLGLAMWGQKSLDQLTRVRAEGLEQAVSVVTAAEGFRKLQGLTKLSRPVMTAAKVGGALAIVGGLLGVADNAYKYASGDRSGGRAIVGGAVSAVAVGAGIALFTPAAPIAAGVLLGVAAAEAALWVWDNNPVVRDAAGAAVDVGKEVIKGAASVVSSGVQEAKEVTKELTKGAIRSVKRLWGR